MLFCLQMLLGKIIFYSLLLNSKLIIKSTTLFAAKMNNKQLFCGKSFFLIFTALFYQICCKQLFPQCNSQSEFWCISANYSKCLKLNEQCFTGRALWKDYTKSNFFVNVDRNMSENVLFESQNVLVNMTRIRFELREFENSTFFRRIFDIGLFKPAKEMVEGIFGNLIFKKKSRHF